MRIHLKFSEHSPQGLVKQMQSVYNEFCRIAASESSHFYLILGGFFFPPFWRLTFFMKHTIGLMLSGLAATILFCACTASPESVAVKISQDESEELSILAETTVTMTQQTIQTTTTTERKPDLVEEVPAEHVLDVDVIYHTSQSQRNPRGNGSAAISGIRCGQDHHGGRFSAVQL